MNCVESDEKESAITESRKAMANVTVMGNIIKQVLNEKQVKIKEFRDESTVEASI